MARRPYNLEYQTKRLIIRPLKATDFRAWIRTAALSLPKQNKFDLDPVPPAERTRAVFSKKLARNRQEAKSDRSYVWNIFSKKTREIVGFIDVSTISREPHQMANLGFFIINTYRGRGYAKEAVREIIRQSFKELKFHRLEGVTDTDNRASIALMKSAGLYREGIKKHYWLQNKRWEDQVVFVAVPELFK